MLAGGIGFGKKQDSLKDMPGKVTKSLLWVAIITGSGWAAVLFRLLLQVNMKMPLNSMPFSDQILKCRKRVYNAIRAMTEMDKNPIISIHDHGAGGHLNSLSELVEATGGEIDITKLPVGDPTLSAKEIIGNESQERMGFLLKDKDVELMKRIAERERAPFYVVGETTGDHRFTFT